MGFGRKFAYSEGRGARDVLAYFTIPWVAVLIRWGMIAVYCSDDSGALDGVKVERLEAKFKANKSKPES